MKLAVKPITRKECSDLILNVHYAHRFPSVSFSFGLFDGENLLGVVTYGTPPSAPLKKGICGDDFKDFVLELNRLVLYKNEKNHASFLISRSLRLIGKNAVIVSFADTDQNHTGVVYQASNFIYCGLSAKRTDWKVKGREHIHGQTIADEFRGVANRVEAMRKKYGDDFYLQPRSRKHRYVYFIGSKHFRKIAMNALKYKVECYPK